MEELISTLVDGPDLDPVNLEGGAVVLHVPGVSPLILGVPEGVGGAWIGVGPWLAAVAVREVAASAADGDVEDEEELSVEGSVEILFVLPWVVEVAREAALGEGVLVMLELQHGGAVELRDDVILGPLQLVGVEAVAEVLSVLVLFVRYFPGVVWEAWTEVERGAKSVDATDVTGGVITSALHDVDLATRRPLAVLDVLREHPDGWPDPVTLWQLSADLDSSVLEAERVDASESRAGDWVDVIATRRSVSLASVEVIAGAVVAWLPAPEAVGALLESLLTKQVLGERRLQVEHAILDEGVRPVIEVHLELPVAATAHGDLVLPGGEVQRVEVILEDQLLGRGCPSKCCRHKLRFHMRSFTFENIYYNLD